MKLEKMGITRLKANKRAVAKLIKHYKGEKELKGCGLCTAASPLSCEGCIWTLMTGDDCGLVRYFRAYPRGKFYKPFARRHLPRLYGWRKAIDNELERRGL